MLTQLNTWLKVRRTCRILEAKSDRMLADIGVERENILALARGLDPADPDANRSIIGRWLASAGYALGGHAAGMAEQRRIRRELSAYRDGELNDIGISRADIPAIARIGVPSHAD